MNIPTDENGRKSMACASNADGITIVPIQCNPTQHAILTDDNTTGSDAGNDSGNASLDENSAPVWAALSSAGDGSIVEVYGDPTSGKLLINSN